MDTTATDRRQITAFFDSRADAEAARDRITALGIDGHDVEIVEGQQGTTAGAPEEKGFMDKLGDFFMGDDDRHSYSEGLRRGGTLLTVMTTGASRDRIVDILDDEGTVDMDAREESWRSEGWSGYDAAAATPATGSTGMGAPGMAEASTAFEGTAPVGDTLEVVQEDVRIGKREVDHGRVKVRSYVVEEDVSEDVLLHDEDVEVHRTPVDRAAGTDPFRDQTIEAEEHHEEAVVSKEARVVEEISLEKTSGSHTETVHETERHTEVEIDDERRAGGSVDADRRARDDDRR